MIASAFAARRGEGRAALVPYFTAGHPAADSTVPVLSALADAGADVIELGIPFSDPLADGPTIQQSSFQSLENGTTVKRVLAALADFRASYETPVVLFTYLNPVLRHGVERFLQEAVDAGANGLLLTDLPTGADPELEAKVVDSPLDLIRLIAPTTSLERVPEVVRGGSGFVYYISRTGVTGARHELRGELEGEIRAIQDAVDLPVAVGFGISTPEQAAAVGAVADGVVVGSAFVRRLGEEGIDAGIDFIRSLREGLDRER
ncbi:MAG: tryptophan synthase subunit alpha [Longimicrobiales bacterium]|nr:tryptophan synthase subunit alpha [Longimicrobiales bacterium]